MKIYILDRTEENSVLLEDPEGTVISVPKELLPPNAKDGDCFCLENEKFVFLEEETKKRRKSISALLFGLISKN